MGVPAFFRWLSRKYPSIVVQCTEEKAKEVDGVKLPADTSLPNPNDVEFDNLYLDMNGIIHPCCHPENKPAPKNEDEMMVAIFEYIDRIFSIVRPRKLLYMAIDGVAPRAKMNQQRSRRFRAAKESREKKVEMEKIRSELKAQGCLLPPEPETMEHFDSNCITPGTEFMARLSACLQYYITERLNNSPGWKSIQVILSDANVPGEGEHKIMDFIRKQRAHPDHNPNTKHCLNGADADLIMLGLASHEPHFTIIREEFNPDQKRPCPLCGQTGHELADCRGLPREKEDGPPDRFTSLEQQFIFIRLDVLREYLEKELVMPGLPFGYDFERCLDDWVFMCFFVGNDFLPHLPSLEIRENAIDRLVGIYKAALPQLGGYLTQDGFVDLKRAQRILSDLGKMEDRIFKDRQEREMNFRRRQQRNNSDSKRFRQDEQNAWRSYNDSWSPASMGSRPFTPPILSRRLSSHSVASTPSPNFLSNQEAAAALRNFLISPTNQSSPSFSSPPVVSSVDSTPSSGKRHLNESGQSSEDTEPMDDVRLWEDGWRDRYYSVKFECSRKEIDALRRDVARHYVKGLCWVLQYYYQGCASWTWYFPYHYAPFASDCFDLDGMDNTFDKNTKPFRPLEQLMAVYPEASGNLVPPTWRALMSDEDSPIKCFYPDDFSIDLNGKKYAWQGVALLPFVDEKLLLDTLVIVYPDLTESEKKRNSLGRDFYFVGKSSMMYDYIMGLSEQNLLQQPQELQPELTGGIRATIYGRVDPNLSGSTYRSPVPGLADLKSFRSVSVDFKDPTYGEGFVFSTKLLPGVQMPPKVLKPEDFPKSSPYRPNLGMNSQRNNSGHSPYSVSPGGIRLLRHSVSPRFQSPSSPPSPRQPYISTPNNSPATPVYSVPYHRSPSLSPGETDHHGRRPPPHQQDFSNVSPLASPSRGGASHYTQRRDNYSSPSNHSTSYGARNGPSPNSYHGQPKPGERSFGDREDFHAYSRSAAAPCLPHPGNPATSLHSSSPRQYRAAVDSRPRHESPSYHSPNRGSYGVQDHQSATGNSGAYRGISPITPPQPRYPPPRATGSGFDKHSTRAKSAQWSPLPRPPRDQHWGRS